MSQCKTGQSKNTASSALLLQRLRTGCSVALMCSLLVVVPNWAESASRKKPEEVQREIDGKVVTCRKASATRWIAGTGKANKFKAFTEQISELKGKVSTASTAKAKKKLQARLKALKTLAAAAKPVCNSVTSSPTPPPGSTPVPTLPPIPADKSLDPLSRPATEADVKYLLRKAGYGYNVRKHSYLLQLVKTGGIGAVVDDLLTVKAEPAGLEARMFERLDDNLTPRSTTRLNYTISGMRKAAIELAIHTNNPVLTRLGWETYFGKWTMSDRPLTNSREYEIFWAYRKMLGEYAKNKNITLGDVLLEISKDPSMLTYLDNGSNLAGDPNENYARELQELYSMGHHRWNESCTEQVANYREEFDGIRQAGDIFQATLALTGWTRIVREIDGEDYFRSAYVEADHRKGAKVLYKGTPHESTVDGLEDVIAAIKKHPGTPQGIALMFTDAYVGENIPCPVLLQYAQLIQASNYNLTEALRVLLKSNLFYSDAYKDRVLKTPLHRTAQFINALGLTYTDLDLVNRTPDTMLQEIGVNISNIVNALDEMGMPTNSPATVFYYDQKAYYSSLAYARQSNLYSDIAYDTAAIGRLIGATSGAGQNLVRLYYDWWRLPGEVLAREAVGHIGEMLGTPFTTSQLDQLEFFMNNVRNTNDPTVYTRQLYDNRSANPDKLIRGLVIGASSPRYYVN